MIMARSPARGRVVRCVLLVVSAASVAEANVNLSECLLLAEQRREAPEDAKLLAEWTRLECHLIPESPTQVFRANRGAPVPGEGAMEMLERNGQKVPRFILQQECDTHQQALVKHDCLLQRFHHATGEFGGEIVDWEKCGKAMENPPKFRWEQLRCEELVEPSPAAKWAMQHVKDTQKKVEADKVKDEADNDKWFDASRDVKQKARKAAGKPRPPKDDTRADMRRRAEEVNEKMKRELNEKLAAIKKESAHLSEVYEKHMEGQESWDPADFLEKVRGGAYATGPTDRGQKPHKVHKQRAKKAEL